MSNNDRLRRNPPRGSALSPSSSNSNGANETASASSNGRPVRQTRQATNGGVRKPIIVDDDDDDLEEIKPAPVKSSSGMIRPSKSSSAAAGASTSSTDVNFDDVAKLESITGLSRTESIELLKACNNNLETAINIHLSNEASESKSIKPTRPSSTKGSLKRTHDDICQSDESSSSAAATSADDDVRAPIPQKTEKLMDYDPYAIRTQNKRPKSVFDGFRNIQEEYKAAETSPSKRKVLSNLAQMYKPPTDLMFSGSLDAAKAFGCKENKWILLNVQKSDSFDCHCLNRDLWRDDIVKEIVNASFVFLLIFEETSEGAKMVNYYTINSYPFIAVLNPRTGEKVAHFKKKYDTSSFCEAVTTFLSDHELPNVHDDTFEDNNADEAANTAVVVVDDEKKTNGFNGHSSEAMTNGKVDLSKNGYFNSITKTRLPNGTAPKGKSAASVLAELTGEPYDEPEVDIEKDESSNDSDQKIYRTGKSKAKLVSSEEEDDEEVVVRKDKYDHQMQRTSSQKLVDDVKQISIDSKKSSPPQILKFETEGTEVKDCFLRVLFPNGDRLDFATNGDSSLKVLTDYLAKLGFKKGKHELIERLMPQYQSKEAIQKDSQVTNQSRNLLSLDLSKLTFKDANLFPRTFLLLQEI